MPSPQVTVEEPSWAHGVEAMNLLAVSLEASGRGAEAVRWYERAARAGHPAAAYNLGIRYRSQGDTEAAAEWFQTGAALGDVECTYALGVLWLERGELTEAEKWLAGAALGGEMLARNALGVVALRRGDAAGALEHFEAAASSGISEAAYNVAALLRDQAAASGSMEAAAEAEYWLTQATLRCDADAAFELGLLARERGDFDEAEARFRVAVQGGNAASAAALADLLELRGAAEQAKALRDSIAS